MNFLQIVAQNKAKISKIDFIEFEILGVDGNTNQIEDLATFVIMGKNKTVSVDVPVSEFKHVENSNHVMISGSWAVENIWNLIRVNQILKK